MHSHISLPLSASSSAATPVYQLDPLHDARWDLFLQTHSRASVFHTRPWLDALRSTYGYKPVVYTTAPPDEQLANGIVFCRVDSWLTGSRLVAVPFADHCQPLVSRSEELNDLIPYAEQACRREDCKYIELRFIASDVPDSESIAGLSMSASFAFHCLDLRPSLDVLFGRLHPSCVQRKIRRAEREGLSCEEGSSDTVLDHFYSLLVLTRRRHGLPPQPLAWFRNLRSCFGNALRVRVVYKDLEPIASILTLTYKSTIVYKYGCSDARFHSLGAMPFLFWRTIQEGKQLGLQALDLGRSDAGDQGLIAFKGHLGAASSTLNYYRYPPQSVGSGSLRRMAFVPKLFARLPNSFLKAAGSFLYRHVG